MRVSTVYILMIAGVAVLAASLIALTRPATRPEPLLLITTDGMGNPLITGSHRVEFTELWRRELGQPILGLAANDDGVVVAYDGGRLEAFDGLGVLRWTQEYGHDFDVGPSVSFGGDILIAKQGELRSLNAHGSTLWTFVNSDPISTTPVMGASRVFFGAAQSLWAIGGKGDSLWRFRAKQRIAAQPAYRDGTVYFGAKDDHLYAVSSDGKSHWSYKTRGDVNTTPLIDEAGNAYFGSDDKHVRSVDRKGELRWKMGVDAVVRAAPVALGELILVQTFGPRERLIALHQDDGSIRWQALLGLLDSAEVGTNISPLAIGDRFVLISTYDEIALMFDEHGCLVTRVATLGASKFAAAASTVYIGDSRELVALAISSSQ